MKLSISLIIPTHNEEKNVSIILHNIKIINAKENLIVDGNSIDKTIPLLKNYESSDYYYGICKR